MRTPQHKVGSVSAKYAAQTAQALYRSFTNDWLSPGLRQLGFRGSSGRYSMPCDSCWVSLAIQKSRSSTRATIEFTINLQVTKKATWENTRVVHPLLPERPNPNDAYYDDNGAAITSPERLGNLLPVPKDWWQVSATTDLDDLARHLLDSIKRFALPWYSIEMASLGCTPSGLSA
jgi:hypothetical protein